MSDKLIINTNLNRKEPSYEPHSCVVEKVIEMSHGRFKSLCNNLLQDNYEISQNKDLMGYSDGKYHCIMAVDLECGDGLLIESEGSNYARYSQYIPHAADIVSTHNQTLAEQNLKIIFPNL